MACAETVGFDVLFALLRRENHTELLPQLLSLKTVRRTVFLTLEPKGSIPRPGMQKKKHSEWSAFLLVTRTGIEPVLPP